MIDPATRDQIKHLSEQKKLSAGQIIDEWAEGSKV